VNPSLTRDAAGSSERPYPSRQGNQAEGEGAAAWQPFAELWQGPLGGRMARYTVGEDLPAEFQDDDCTEDAETSRDYAEKNAGTITGKLRTKANHREADAELTPWRMATIPTSRDDRCDDVTQHPYPFTTVSGIGATNRLLRRRDVSSRNRSM